MDISDVVRIDKCQHPTYKKTFMRQHSLWPNMLKAKDIMATVRT